MKKAKPAIIVLALAAIIVVVVIVGTARRGGIQVGVVLPLTGAVAEPGNNVLEGLKLAIEEFNNSRPQRRVALLVEDSRSLPKEGVSAITKLITVNKIKVVVGDLMSSVTLAMAPIAERNKVVLLAPGASAPAVRDAGDYIFRIWASDNYDGKVMAQYLHQQKRQKVAVAYVNNDYGVGLAGAFKQEFESLGGSVVAFEGYAQGATDFRSLVTKIGSARADCIYLPGQPRENGLIVKQIRELALDQPITANLSVESPDFLRSAGSAAAGITYTTPMFDPQSEDPLATAFARSYQAQTGERPDVCAGHGYDAGRILLHALKQCSFDLSRLKDSLYGVRDFPGVTGRTSFDEKGDVLKDVMIKVLDEHGKGAVIRVFSPAS